MFIAEWALPAFWERVRFRAVEVFSQPVSAEAPRGERVRFRAAEVFSQPVSAEVPLEQDLPVIRASLGPLAGSVVTSAFLCRPSSAC